MASKDKPYRVYRGGRGRGSAGRATRLEPYQVLGRDGGPHLPAPPVEAPPRRHRRRRWILIGLGLVLLAAVVVVAWLALGYLAFRSGIKDANRRLDGRARLALTAQHGALFSTPTNLLLIGADAGPGKGREGPGRSDTLLLVHTDPGAHRIGLLSIPRDLRVEIPGHGPDKINAAYAIGGPALAIRAVESLTGLPVNHVAVVDFATFPQVIDALGGITVTVPERIVSNRFDCPYATLAQCNRWPGWRFRKGRQTMDGRRALVYARIRENRLDPSETDIARGGRQQQVVEAIAGRATSLRTFLRLPFVGDDLVKPLATDLSAGQLLELGWVKLRAPGRNTLRCRLGGTAAQIGDGDFIVGSEENVAVVAMVEGKSAPQPPAPGGGPFAPGCVVG